MKVLVNSFHSILKEGARVRSWVKALHFVSEKEQSRAEENQRMNERNLQGKHVNYLKVQRKELGHKKTRTVLGDHQEFPRPFRFFVTNQETRTNTVVITMQHCYLATSLPNSTAYLLF